MIQKDVGFKAVPFKPGDGGRPAAPVGGALTWMIEGAVPISGL
jgi:hypothetical protein